MDAVKVSVKRKVISLKVTAHEWYPIDFRQVETIADVKDRLFHLETKRWFTPKVRRQFIAAVKKINGWD